MRRIVVVLLFVVFSSALFAAARTVDLTQSVHALDGSVISQTTAKDSPPATLGWLLEKALSSNLSGDESAGEVPKMACYRLALTFRDKDKRFRTDVMLDSADVQLLRGRLAKMVSSEVFGAVVSIIDPESLKK